MSWSLPPVARNPDLGWKSRVSTGWVSCQLIWTVPPFIMLLLHLVLFELQFFLLFFDFSTWFWFFGSIKNGLRSEVLRDFVAGRAREQGPNTAKTASETIERANDEFKKWIPDYHLQLWWKREVSLPFHVQISLSVLVLTYLCYYFEREVLFWDIPKMNNVVFFIFFSFSDFFLYFSDVFLDILREFLCNW
jgi:hypothetical protein